jgi:hypothetical protein
MSEKSPKDCPFSCYIITSLVHEQNTSAHDTSILYCYEITEYRIQQQKIDLTPLMYPRNVYKIRVKESRYNLMMRFITPLPEQYV